MSSFTSIFRWVVFGCFLFNLSVLQADTSAPASSTKPYSSKPQTQVPAHRKEEPVQPYKQLARPELPPMTKPFGMPGVIGMQNGKWEGTDYLGYLSNNIGIDVEILKADNVPQVSDIATIESRLANIFTKEDINARADVTEGPPLPFLHVLLIIYPVDKDRYVIFGNGRLFEQIEVIRKDFIPAGYWQGITWENQDIAIASGQQLDAQMKALADKLGTAFAKRYRQYNLNNEGRQESQNPSPEPPEPL